MRLCALVIGVVLAASQQQQPIIRSRVTMVPLDVRVLDRDGRPITDLTAKDFTITEDGVVQTIAHFATHRLAPDPVVAAAPLAFTSDAPAGTPPAASNRRVIFVILARGRHQAFKYVDALEGFIGDSLMPQDQIAVTAWNRTTDFTVDHDRIRRIVARYRERHERIETLLREWFSGLRGQYGDRTIPPHIQKEIDWVFEEAANIRQPPSRAGHPGLAEFMRRAAPPSIYGDTFKLIVGLNYLRHLEGEKRVLMVSTMGQEIPHPRDPHRGIAAMASNARIAIDIIQTGGTVGVPAAGFVGPMSNRRISMPVVPSSGAVSNFIWGLQDLRESAALTGGHAITLKTGPEAFRRLAEATSFQYTLGYYPLNTASTEDFRAIAVKVSRPGARVVTRNGYFASQRSTAVDLRDFSTASRMREATMQDDAIEGIGLQLTGLKALQGPPRELEAELKIDVSRVSVIDEDGLRIASFDVAILCMDERRRLVGELRRRVDLKVKPERWAGMTANGMMVSLRVPLTGTPRDLKAIAYDYASDRLGSVTVRLQGQ